MGLRKRVSLHANYVNIPGQEVYIQIMGCTCNKEATAVTCTCNGESTTVGCNEETTNSCNGQCMCDTVSLCRGENCQCDTECSPNVAARNEYQYNSTTWDMRNIPTNPLCVSDGAICITDCSSHCSSQCSSDCSKDICIDCNAADSITCTREVICSSDGLCFKVS